MGTNLEVNPATGKLDLVSDTHHNISEILTGTSEEQQSLNVVVDGANICMETEAVGGGDIEYIFDNVDYALDCTTGAGTDGKAQVVLTAGTATVAQINYVYITLVAGVATLTAGTSIPTGQFAWHSIVTLLDTGETTTHGPLSLQRTTEALSHGGRGQQSYMREKLRWLGPKYVSGCAQILSGTTTIELTVAGGVVFQLHRQTFPGLAVVADGITVSNADGGGTLTKLQNIHDLNLFSELADGSSVGINKWFSGTVWATMASDDQNGNQSKLFLNLPTGQYNSESAAIADSSNFDVRTAPAEFNNTAFLVGRVVFKKTAGDHTIIGAYSLTGAPMGTIGGGAGSTALTEFADTNFKVYDNDDATRIIDMDAMNITGGNTRSIIMADRDVDLATPQFDTVDVVANGTTPTSIVGSSLLNINGDGNVFMGLKDESSGRDMFFGASSSGSDIVFGSIGAFPVSILTQATRRLTISAAGEFDFLGNNITNPGTVDGVDIGTDVPLNTTNISLNERLIHINK